MAKVVLTLLANRAVKAKRSSSRSVAFATAKARSKSIFESRQSRAEKRKSKKGVNEGFLESR